MTRGVPHSAELRAEVIAAIIAGTTIADAAARFNLDKSIVSRWAAADATVATTRAMVERTPEALASMIYDLVVEHITTLRAQLQTAAAASYVQGQTAGDLAALLGTERDTLIRLLAGFRPVEPDQQRELAEPASAAPSATDHDH